MKVEKWLQFIQKLMKSVHLWECRKEDSVVVSDKTKHTLITDPVSISSVQFSWSVMSDSLRPHGLQHARPPCPSPTPRVHSNSLPSSRWCHPPSHPLSSPAHPAFNLSQHQGLFQWVGSLHPVAKVLELQLQHQSFQWIFRTDFL